MNILLVAAALSAASPSIGTDEPLDAYLKLRAEHNIVQSAGVAALETLVGERTLEVAGTVSGVIGGPKGKTLIVDSTTGEPIFVQCTEVPEWLTAGGVKARLLVRAKKATEVSVPAITLLGVIPEHEIAKYEMRQAAEARKRQEEIAKSNSERPKRMPGDIPILTQATREYTPVISAQVAAVLPQYMGFIQHHNKHLSEKDAYQIALGIVAYSVQYGVDARLILAMVLAESGFDPTVVSSAGAMGLGQLMPGTAKALGVSDPFDISQNLYGTVRTIRGHLDRQGKVAKDEYENLILALAAYNAGPGAVKKYGGVPPYKETEAYIAKVVKMYRRLCGYSDD